MKNPNEYGVLRTIVIKREDRRLYVQLINVSKGTETGSDYTIVWVEVVSRLSDCTDKTKSEVLFGKK